MKKLVAPFLQGLLFIMPLGITSYIVYVIYKFIDSKLDLLVSNFFENPILGTGAIAFVVIVVLIILLGLLIKSIIAQPFIIFLNKLMEKAPLIKIIYSSVRDLVSAFVGDKKKFDKPVLVKVNTISDLEKIGFITQTDLSNLKITNKVSVYFPHCYTFAGEMFIVPVENITTLEIPASEAMKFIVSGGVTKI